MAENTSGWRPIKTAPRDMPILVFCPDPVEIPEETYCWPATTKVRVTLAHWHEPDFQSSEPAGWYAPFTVFYGGVSSDPSCEFNSVELSPTHWMPFPMPPNE